MSGNAGADGSGNINTENGTVVEGDFTAQYYVFQISQAGDDPGICEVYFLISSQSVSLPYFFSERLRLVK